MCVQLRQLRLFNAAEDEAAPGDVSASLFAGCCQISSLTAETTTTHGQLQNKSRELHTFDKLHRK